MIFKLSEDNSLSSVPQLRNFGKLCRDKKSFFFFAVRICYLSRLKIKEFTKNKRLVKDQVLPSESIEIIGYAIGIRQLMLSLSMDSLLASVCLI